MDSLVALTPKFEPFELEEQGLRALEIAQEIGYEIGEANTLNKLGIWYQVKRKPEKSFECLNKAKAIFDEFGEDRDILDNLFLLTNTHRLLYYYKESLDLGAQTLVLAEQLGDSLIIGKGFTAMPPMPMAKGRPSTPMGYVFMSII